MVIQFGTFLGPRRVSFQSSAEVREVRPGVRRGLQTVEGGVADAALGSLLTGMYAGGLPSLTSRGPRGGAELLQKDPQICIMYHDVMPAAERKSCLGKTKSGKRKPLYPYRK